MSEVVRPGSKERAAATSRPVVLIPGPVSSAVVRAFLAHFEVVQPAVSTDDVAALGAAAASARAVVSAGARVDGNLMRRLPALQIVVSLGVGYDAVDVAEAVRRKVVVTNTPDVLTEDVADVALGLLLMVVRQLSQAERHLREGRWLTGPFPLASTRMHGRKVGILGLGRIGEAVARRLTPLGAEISYHNRSARSVPYRYCESVAALAEEVDTLVITTPGGPGTRHMVDADVLARLGTNGVVVNVARGSVIDSKALVRALESGTILAAGLDVFDDEPDVPDALLQLPNAVLLPHIGSATRHSRQAMAQLAVDNLLSWFRSGTALTPVPETAHLALKDGGAHARLG